jgi:hypothetical protein
VHQVPLVDLLLGDLELEDALLFQDRDGLQVARRSVIAVDDSTPLMTVPSAAAALKRNLGTAGSYLALTRRRCF